MIRTKDLGWLSIMGTQSTVAKCGICETWHLTQYALPHAGAPLTPLVRPKAQKLTPAPSLAQALIIFLLLFSR